MDAREHSQDPAKSNPEMRISLRLLILVVAAISVASGLLVRACGGRAATPTPRAMRAYAILDDGRTVVTDGLVIDTAHGRVDLEGAREDDPFELTFSEGGRWLAGVNGRRVQVWDGEAGRRRVAVVFDDAWDEPGCPLPSRAFYPGGGFYACSLAFVGRDHLVAATPRGFALIRLDEVRVTRSRFTPEEGAGESAGPVQALPSGELALWTPRGALRTEVLLIDAFSPWRRRRLLASQPVAAVLAASDARSLVVLSEGGEGRLLEVFDPVTLRRTQRHEIAAGVDGISVGRNVAALWQGARVRVLDLASGYHLDVDDAGNPLARRGLWEPRIADSPAFAPGDRALMVLDENPRVLRRIELPTQAGGSP